MKNICLLLAIVICLTKLNAQITLNSTYSHPGGTLQSSRMWLDKFHVSGYKYVQVDYTTKIINIYNLNQSLFKTITVPAPAATALNQVYTISENLYDLDNGIEYAVQALSPNRVWILDESGAIILYRDSASFPGASGFGNVFENNTGVYYDGIGTKMILNIQLATSVYKHEIYDLPGTIPCISCSNGTVSGFYSNLDPNTDSENAKFFPNPVTDQLKLKYNLPPESKNAKIKIYDAQGKMLEDFKITSTFDFIYLPSNYNNGLYFYSLIVDEKLIKTEKIILSK